jgi:hypothetical protein
MAIGVQLAQLTRELGRRRKSQRWFEAAVSVGSCATCAYMVRARCAQEKLAATACFCAELPPKQGIRRIGLRVKLIFNTN